MSLSQYDIIPANTPYSFFVVLQSDLLGDLTTRVVAPLVDASKVSALESLWPKVTVNNTAYVVMIPLTQSIRPDPSAVATTNIAPSGPAIQRALDLLFKDPE
ncbi:MAG TPA: CcdB family protein [Rhizomicrobium sp.]|nr:CcdB family protein [Rhizomicrobium sp.]